MIILLMYKCLLLSCAVLLSILIFIGVCSASVPRDFLYCNISFHLLYFSLSTFLRGRVSNRHNHHSAPDSHVNTTKPNSRGENRFVMWLWQTAHVWRHMICFFWKLEKNSLIFFLLLLVFQPRCFWLFILKTCNMIYVISDCLSTKISLHFTTRMETLATT